jgi:serine protease AprX
MKRKLLFLILFSFVFTVLVVDSNAIYAEEVEIEIITLSDPNITSNIKVSPNFFEEVNEVDGSKVKIVVQVITENWNTTKRRLSMQKNVFDKNGDLRIFSSEARNNANVKVYQNELFKINKEAVKDFEKSISINFELISKSKETPFVTIEINKEDLKTLIANNNVASVKLFNPLELEQEENIECVIEAAGCGGVIDPPSTEEDIRTPFETVNVDYAHSNGITGDGIKVGILDSGQVEPVDYLLFQSRIISNPNLIQTITEHATAVALIASGKEGMAPDSIVYSTGRNVAGVDLSEEFSWFIQNGVHIVNISAAMSGYCTVSYDSDWTQYTDYISRAYFITIIKSSGNNECSDNHKITRPGLGSNVITVGATNNLGTQVASYSNYIEDSSADIDKPNLVAPGGEFGFGEYETYETLIGTSFSTPMVTGAIALLYEKFPTLKYKPHIASAMLMASSNNDVISDNGTLNNSGLYDFSGAGLLDINALLYSTAITEWEYNSSSLSFNVSLEGTGEYKIATTWLRNQHFTTDVDDSLFNVEVSKTGGAFLASKSISYGNVNIIEIPGIPASGYGLYTITITHLVLNKGSYIYNENPYEPNNSVIGATAIYIE